MSELYGKLLAERTGRSALHPTTWEPGTDPEPYMDEVRAMGPAEAALVDTVLDNAAGCGTVAGCCEVEPDGTCHHGSPSVLLAAGYI